MRACEKGQKKLVDVLLSKEASVNSCEKVRSLIKIRMALQ